MAKLNRDFRADELDQSFDRAVVAAVTGMSETYLAKAVPNVGASVTLRDVLTLLDLDAFAETFVPRSRVPRYLLGTVAQAKSPSSIIPPERWMLLAGSATDLIPQLPTNSIQCVVTSTPYWGTRLYEDWIEVEWADGECCPFGHEQTPEGFIRHTVEILYLLKPALTSMGSIWWNLMDTYNTRTQIRGSAAETLRAMRGLDERGWGDYECRRYSAGHSFLKDGEQCLIPQRVAERAARIGYWIKSVITWKKDGSMPETVGTRVTRELEYIIHLAIQRSPFFDKSAFNMLPAEFGGRNPHFEAEKITDVWCLPTSAGQDGHGAQFPVQLPVRCVALSTRPGDLVLDPFVGSGTTAVAARLLNRRALGFDVSERYLSVARQRLEREHLRLSLLPMSPAAE